MRLTADFQAIVLDQRRLTRSLHEMLSETLAEACRVWLTTVIQTSTDAGLPVWSAASVATLAPLASFVGYSLALTPEAGVPSRVTIGMANGEAEFEPGTRDPRLYTFTYYTTLPHLVVNEYHNANVEFGTDGKRFHLRHPGPYHFQEKGEKAFRAFASTIVLPGWGSLLDIATIHAE